MTTYIPSLTLPTTLFQNAAASTLLPIALGTVVGYSTRPKDTQRSYLAIKQPPLRPPPYVFGPVWTLLYGLMGYSAHRIARIGLASLASPDTVQTARHSLTLYTIQLGLNLIWMPLFFGIRRPIEASLDIVALLGVNAYITYLWAGIDNVAAWCQAPYLGWLSFATYLCVGCGYLNNWDLSGMDIQSVDEQK